jgi:heat shock protein HslJ
MTHHDLTDLLERAADRTDVGPAPVDGMLRGVRRRRHRHAALAGAGLTVVAVTTAIAVPVLTDPPGDRSPAQPQTIPDSSSSTTTPSPPARSIDLEGRWIVVALVRKSGRPAPTRYHHLRFHVEFRDGRVRASDGCNQLSGGYAIDGDHLRLKHATVTLRGCLPRPAPFFERLSDVTSVARDQGGTYLEDADGNVVIAMVPR